MPALDFTTFPSKPAAPPAVSTGAPRQSARVGAPKTGPQAGSKTGSPSAASGEFGQLVDRLADAPNEDQTSSRGAIGRGARDTGVISEESAAEPRAKGDADGASGTANDAPAVLASMASNPSPFPWTLPLNPSLWNFEQVQGDGASAGEAGEGDGDGVIGAATAAIADSAAGACLATLPGTGTDAKASKIFAIHVDAPIAVDASGATVAIGAPALTAAGTLGAEDASAIDAIDTAAWTGAAGAAGSVYTEAGDDRLANSNIAGAAFANAAMTSGQFGDSESTIGQSAASALASNTLEQLPSVDPNDSALLAQRAMVSATTAAAVDGSAATTAAEQTGQANAAINAPLPGDQAREQALIELQRALESAGANAASATAKPQSRNGDAPIVLQTGTSAGAASDDAVNAASAAAAIEGAATAGEGSAVIGTLVSEAVSNSSASPSARTGRSRDAYQISEDATADSAATDVSSWAAAAAAKYAEAAGAGTSSEGGTRDSGSNADAAASIALAGRAGGDAGSVAPIGFDARVVAASRADNAAALPDGWAGESAIVTTAAPEEQAAQIVRSMRLQWRGANGEATLRLQPDHLGQVFVNVRVEQGTVSATVRAETPAAQQWIQQHQQQLRDALDAQGLRVAQFRVTSNPDDRPRRDHEQDQNQDATGRRSSRARARRDDGDRSFEIHL